MPAKKKRHYRGNRHYSTHCHNRVYPSVQSGFIGTIAATSTTEGSLLCCCRRRCRRSNSHATPYHTQRQQSQQQYSASPRSSPSGPCIATKKDNCGAINRLRKAYSNITPVSKCCTHVALLRTSHFGHPPYPSDTRCIAWSTFFQYFFPPNSERGQEPGIGPGYVSYSRKAMLHKNLSISVPKFLVPRQHQAWFLGFLWGSLV